MGVEAARLLTFLGPCFYPAEFRAMVRRGALQEVENRRAIWAVFLHIWCLTAGRNSRWNKPTPPPPRPCRDAARCSIYRTGCVRRAKPRLSQPWWTAHRAALWPAWGASSDRLAEHLSFPIGNMVIMELTSFVKWVEVYWWKTVGETPLHFWGKL